MRTVVFCFEHLPACSLGCYGEWNIATPEFDALASQSLVVENFFVSPASSSLLQLLAARDPDAVLIHNEALDPKTVSAFAHAWSLKSGEIPTQDQLYEFLQRSDPVLICVHFAAGESDRNTLEAAASGWLEHQSDAMRNATDFLPEWRQKILAHAAEVKECDAALGAWLDLLEEVLEVGDAIVLTAASGDDRRLPDDRPAWLKSVSEPLTHLPLILHRAGHEDRQRTPLFFNREQAADLIMAHEFSATTQPDQERATISYRSDLARGVRNCSWLLVESLDISESNRHFQGESELRLFRKPEDVWEIHDVASQFPDLIERYRENGTIPV